jgi:hypothetical protein
MEDAAKLVNSSSTETAEPTTGTWKNAFPMQLHCLLSEAETDGMAHVASFCVHGRAFQTHKLDVFVEKILPWSVSLLNPAGKNSLLLVALTSYSIQLVSSKQVHVFPAAIEYLWVSTHHR